MKIAVIPARGGSKRIPKKNIKIFYGKPIIAWSIEAALESKLFDKVIVSTDDKSISKVALDFGAEVPFVRPANLSDDHTPGSHVIKHAVNWALEEFDGNLEFVCTIYATAPFVSSKNLRLGYEMLKSNKSCQIVFSATSFPFPIQRAIKISEKGTAEMFQPEHLMSRSQDLEPAYHDAGQFYWARAMAIMEDISPFSELGMPFILPKYLVQDIDTKDDWERAELMYELVKIKLPN